MDKSGKVIAGIMFAASIGFAVKALVDILEVRKDKSHEENDDCDEVVRDDMEALIPESCESIIDELTVSSPATSEKQ